MFWDKVSNEKTKNIFGIFLRKFPEKKIILGFNNFISEENKNIYGNAFIPWKSHWNIGLMSGSCYFERSSSDKFSVEFWIEGVS